MSTKSLSDFTKKKKEVDNSLVKDFSSLKENSKKKIGVTLRLNPEDWERLHYLSIQERTKIQHLLLEGLNSVLNKRGLPLID
jgi:hypothetical protein